MKNNAILIALVTLLIGGAIGFFGGTQYQKSQRTSLGQFGNNQFATRSGSGAFGAGRGGRNGGGVIGDILSIDQNSITVKLPDGSSKIVLLTSATSINKATVATASDLSVGTRVAAFGTTNTDGSVTASNVQINPVGRGPIGTSGANGATNSGTHIP